MLRYGCGNFPVGFQDFFKGLFDVLYVIFT